MAFSLALAGSVMVTVSIVSIGPECLAASSMPKNAQHSSLDSDNSFFIFGITLMPLWSIEFLHRLLSFGAGCLLYFLLSKYAFPDEPEEILANHLEKRNVRRSSNGSIASDKSSDSEDEDEIDSTGTNSKKTNKSPDKVPDTIINNMNSSLQRRGGNDDNDIELARVGIAPNETIWGKRKGLFRRPPTERTIFNNPFTYCMSSLRTFTRGSDLDSSEARRANRVAMLLFFSLLIHNFPEGLATFVAALDDPSVGAVLAIAIGIHNIPEGLCVALPIYYATGNRWKAFMWGCLSGLSEPVAALLGWAVLAKAVTQDVYAILFGLVSGMMVIISLKELIPTAHRYDPEDTVVTYSLIGGMVIIALSLVLFKL